MKPIIIIPARMQATRLPGKPLLTVGDAPMIVQVWRRAQAANIGPVYVACGEVEIAQAVEQAGGKAVLTDPHHPSGSDRIFEALQTMDPRGEYDVVVNLQGDMPTLDPAIIKMVLLPLENREVDIATLAAPITQETERNDPNVVKAVLSFHQSRVIGRALYFTRTTAPHGEGALYHHIGIYAYRRAALKKFVALPPSMLEKRERLEQLRALEAGLRIDVAIVNTVPLGVDTAEGLEKARKHMVASI